MHNIFETFKPANEILSKYIHYYYLDIKPDNKETTFECFPHFNNTVSLYKSHIRSDKGELIFDRAVKPLQIFTPVRENVLRVTQKGFVHRVVIVFEPVGIYHFYRHRLFSGFITDFEFFSENELNEIFSTSDTNLLKDSLDRFLIKRFSQFNNELLRISVDRILSHYEDFSVEQHSETLRVSRRHLNRVFKSYLGVSIKKFHEIVLFRKTIERKLFVNPGENFTQLAHEFNYADQSHLNKIYRTFTDHSPKNFFRKGTLLGREDTFWHIRK